MIGDRQYCNKYGCDWVVHHHVEDEYLGELTVYECRRCGARQAKWCNTWKKRAGLLTYPVTVKPRIGTLRIIL